MNPPALEFSLWPLRLCIASVFVVHGWWMLTDVPFYTWLFERMNIAYPAVTTPLVGVAEFFGGLGLIAGVLTRFTSAVLSIVIVTAIFMAYEPTDFYGGWAFDLVILGGLLAILVNGPGRPTLGSMLRKSWRDPEELVWRRLRS